MISRIRLSPALLLFLVQSLGAADRVEFNRDIRPIFSDTCFQCHGPDKNTRKAKLRLHLEESGKDVVVPGKVEQRKLIRRLTTTKEHERMPPLKSGRKLTRQRIDLVKRGVAEGAKWPKHWAFEPSRAVLPPVVRRFEVRPVPGDAPDQCQTSVGR